MRVPNGRTIRAAAVAVVLTAAAGACSAPPEPTTVEWFEGGDHPVELLVEPQTVTTEFSLFGLISCTSTAVTPSVDLVGTLSVAPVELDPASTRVVIPGATLQLPDSTVSAGSLSLWCNGTHLGTVGVSLRFDATASVQSVVLDTTTSTLTLTDPTLTLSEVQAVFADAPAGASPTPLAPITVTVPTIDVQV